MNPTNSIQILFIFIGLLGTFAIISVSGQHEQHHQQTMDNNQVVILPEHCLQKRAIESNYVPTGYIWTFDPNGPNSIQIYETKNETDDGGRVLFVAYDVFGFHPNTKQVIDKLAEAGKFKIVMPDFFGGGWSINDWPASNQGKFQNFLARNGSWENVQRVLENLIPYYKEHRNIKQFGIFGFCWGGRMSVLASANLNANITAAAIIHPAAVVTTDANSVKTPMYLIPSGDEPDMIPFYDILVKKFGAENVGHKRFSDMHHGFSAARGDFNNHQNRQAVDEVIEILNKFFNQHLKSGGGRTSHSTMNLMCLLAVVYLTVGILLDSK